MDACRVCGTEANQRCKRCKNAFYCGKECQVEDWSKGGHRDTCLSSTSSKSPSKSAPIEVRLKDLPPNFVNLPTELQAKIVADANWQLGEISELAGDLSATRQPQFWRQLFRIRYPDVSLEDPAMFGTDAATVDPKWACIAMTIEKEAGILRMFDILTNGHYDVVIGSGTWPHMMMVILTVDRGDVFGAPVQPNTDVEALWNATMSNTGLERVEERGRLRAHGSRSGGANMRKFVYGLLKMGYMYMALMNKWCTSHKINSVIGNELIGNNLPPDLIRKQILMADVFDLPDWERTGPVARDYIRSPNFWKEYYEANFPGVPYVTHHIEYQGGRHLIPLDPTNPNYERWQVLAMALVRYATTQENVAELHFLKPNGELYDFRYYRRYDETGDFWFPQGSFSSREPLSNASKGFGTRAEFIAKLLKFRGMFIIAFEEGYKWRDPRKPPKSPEKKNKLPPAKTDKRPRTKWSLWKDKARSNLGLSKKKGPDSEPEVKKEEEEKKVRYIFGSMVETVNASLPVSDGQAMPIGGQVKPTDIVVSIRAPESPITPESLIDMIYVNQNLTGDYLAVRMWADVIDDETGKSSVYMGQGTDLYAFFDQFGSRVEVPDGYAQPQGVDMVYIEIMGTWKNGQWTNPQARFMRHFDEKDYLSRQLTLAAQFVTNGVVTITSSGVQPNFQAGRNAAVEAMCPPTDPSKGLINYADIRFGKELGRGAFGVVVAGTYRGQPVAIKTVQGQPTPKAIEEFTKEAQLLANLPAHPNVVRFIGITQNPLVLVTELVTGGGLDSRLKPGKPPVPWSDVLRWARDIARGIGHMHASGIVHRDLATRNVLLDDKGNAKITDFGLSKRVCTQDPELRFRQQEFFRGPYKWMPPESLQSQDFSVKSDTWAYGVVLWEIASRRSPFEFLDIETVKQWVIRNKMRLPLPLRWPQRFRDLLMSCWRTNPSDRPNMPTISATLRAIGDTAYNGRPLPAISDQEIRQLYGIR